MSSTDLSKADIRKKLIIALDLNNIEAALQLATDLVPNVGFFRIGSSVDAVNRIVEEIGAVL